MYRIKANAETKDKTGTSDQLAAHEFLTELRTRIATQPLPYQYGIESSALQSLYELFDFARNAIKNNPGCSKFAAKVSELLNVHLRPVTGKWHNAKVHGILDSRDGADKFRGELNGIQFILRQYANIFHRMAYGTDYQDKLSPIPFSEEELNKNLHPLQYGIPADYLTDGNLAKINADEANEIKLRRNNYRLRISPDINAVGLALSGGGIRSATFSLGIVQVLAQRHLLQKVDYLSTVSGGGYIGSFLTSRLGSGEPIADFANPFGPDSQAVRYLRQHAKFLAARNLKQGWSMAISRWEACY
jgi:hypothetical protein